jgi:hypothetical protein
MFLDFDLTAYLFFIIMNVSQDFIKCVTTLICLFCFICSLSVNVSSQVVPLPFKVGVAIPSITAAFNAFSNLTANNYHHLWNASPSEVYEFVSSFHNQSLADIVASLRTSTSSVHFHTLFFNWIGNCALVLSSFALYYAFCHQMRPVVFRFAQMRKAGTSSLAGFNKQGVTGGTVPSNVNSTGDSTDGKTSAPSNPATEASDIDGNEVIEVAPEVTTETGRQTISAEHALTLEDVAARPSNVCPLAKSSDAVYMTPMFVKNMSVTTVMPVGRIIDVGIGWNDIRGLGAVTRLFNDRIFATFDIRFTFNVTGNRCASGNLLLFTRPIEQGLPNGPFAQDPNLAVYSPINPLDAVSSLPHVVVDVSKTTTYILDVPYTSIYSMLTTNRYQTTPTWFTVNGIVLNTFRAQIGSTNSVSIEVYATLTNIKYLEVTALKAQILDYTSVNYNIDQISDSTLPNNVTGDAVSVSALDNPSYTPNVFRRMLMGAYQKLFYTKNVTDVTRFSTDPSRLNTFTPLMKKSLRIAVDEMSTSFFNSRWCYYGSNVMVPTNVAGTLLFKIPLMLNPNPSGGLLRSTGISDLSSFARFWRGGLRFRFILGTNTFKNGKLMFAIHYDSYYSAFPAVGSVLFTGAPDPRSVHHIIVDTSSTDTVIDIDVPFKSCHEFLRCAAAITTTNGDFGGLPAYSMGTLAVYVASPLQVSNSVDPTVSIACMSSWASDMKLYEPYTYPSLYAQSSLRPCDAETTLVTRTHSLACLESLKDILLKPIMYSEAIIPANTGRGFQPLLLPISPIFMMGTPEWSFFMNCYAGFSGSMRVYVRSLNNNVPIQVAYYPTYPGPVPDPSPVGDNCVVNDEIANMGMTGGAPIHTLNPYPSSLTLGYIRANRARMYFPPSGHFIQSSGAGRKVILHPNTPEVIVEVPDNCPMYRTNPSLPIPTDYDFGAVGTAYKPRGDPILPWISITPLYEATDTPASVDCRIQVFVSAGDDFRGYWFKGGPSSAAFQLYSFGTPIPTALSGFYALPA